MTTPTASDIENLIRALVAEVTEKSPDEIDPAQAFVSYGLASVDAVSIAGDLADHLDLDVSPTVAWDHPTIAGAALHLAEMLAAAAAPAVRPAAPPLSAPTPVTDPAAPLAVVGIGCRFPGGAQDRETFWQLLAEGRDAVTTVPADRWDADAFYDPDPDAPGRSYARHGAFLDDVAGFDATLFGVSPREAESMDPQHRLLMEVAWQAMEDAGLAPDALRGSRTGVFVGMGGSDYERLGLTSGGGAAAIDAYVATGNAGNFAANRLSYSFGFEGPSMVVDTACSSSLVALHLAAQSLRAGDCDLALVGGVSLMLSPDPMIALAKGRMLSPAGRCATFDAAADGYVRGEGGGVVVLRRQPDAERAGSPVLAVLRGTAVNQDGRSNGLTAPSGTAQESVVRRALDVAGIAPADVGYVEAHGTGTPLGDPVEVRALARVLGEGRDAARPVVLGSVKTNIGHLEAAAGIAGLIKTVLALAHGRIPPHLHLSRPNPHIAWADLPVTVPTGGVAWTDEVRVAGVSSFGFGGTNAHAVLTSSPAVAPVPGREVPGPLLVPVSAASAGALRASAARLGATVEREGVAAVAGALALGRAALAERCAVVATDVAGASAALAAAGRDETHPLLRRGRRRPGPPPGIALLAPGHGADVAGALEGLYGHDEVVTRAVDELVPALGPVDGFPLAALISRTEDTRAALTRTEVAQPALYALAVSLGAWWLTAGIRPVAVLGHSVGAYAAAALAGVLTPLEGARLIRTRGELMGTLPTGGPQAGAMAAVKLGPDDVARLGPVARGEVVVAALNGPRETVVSGPAAAVHALAADLGAAGTRVVVLPMPYAFHSPLTDPVLDRLRAAVEGAGLREPTLPLVSDATGALATSEVTDPGYWVRHTREVVRFGDAVATAGAAGARIVVELGPGALLAATAAAGPEGLLTVASTAPGRPAAQGLVDAAAQVWVEGVTLRWDSVLPEAARAGAARVPLPTYPFAHRTFWLPGLTPPAPAASPAPPAPRESGAVRPVPAPTVTTGPSAADLTAFLRRELAEVLGLADPRDLDADIGLFDLGLTSMTAMDLRARVEREIGRPISSTAVFDHPTLTRLAAHLAGTGTATHRRRRRTGGDAEPVAVVGMACRLPGGLDDLDAYWAALAGGRDATGPVPADRWDPALTTARGGFLTGPVADFDASAFGISPREAAAMDPQQRLLLEVAWEALEDAGVPAGALEGSATGVYVGINTSDHLNLLSANGTADGPIGPGNADGYLATGNTFSVAAGRLSYLLGAQGPALAVDTACSSSLVAAHLATRSLRSGESDLALVGGVNLMLSPATTGTLASLGALAADGRCKTFDAAADGYGRGEGAGVVVLKRLSDAQADGDRIWAVLRGSAVNQDGRSAGLTVPNGGAQVAVITEALADAAVAAADIGYVEAHGTGTPLGDPLELEALAEALRPDGGDPVVVGSAKANIGHLEAAAGIAGLIKVALSLHHGTVPPHLHLTTPNPRLDWDRLPVRIPDRAADWAPRSGTRLAGLSSFGFSGTNAHLVLEQAPPVTVPPETSGDGGAQLLVLSARTPAALDALATRYRDRLDVTGAPAWPDLTRAAARHRGPMAERLAVTARDTGQAVARLTAAARGETPDGVRRGRAGTAGGGRLVWTFSGQGAQWAGMGRSLLDLPEAARVLHELEDLVAAGAGWSLLEQLTADPDRARLDDTVHAQPAIFAVQAALIAVWRSWGITPDVVVGHSVGEVAAAHAAGVLDLATATEVVLRRAEVMAPSRGRGAMAAIGLPAERVRDLLAPFGGDLAVAAVNGPADTVVGGEPGAVARLETVVRGLGALWTTVQREYAFHTPQMEAFAPALAVALAGTAPAPAVVPMISSVTGEAVTGTDLDASYWVGNMVRPVRFMAAVRAAAGGRDAVLLELGPHAVLTGPASRSLEGGTGEVTALRSMRRGKAARETLLDAVGGLHVLGRGGDLPVRLQPPSGRHVDLPTYPWQRSRHWLPAATRAAGAPTAAAPSPLAGSPSAADVAAHTYRIEWPETPARHVPGGERAGAGAGGPWLLLADGGGTGERLAAVLRGLGERVETVPAAVPGEPAGAVTARAVAALEDLGPVQGLIACGSLDLTVDLTLDHATGRPGAGPDAALEASCAPLLALPPLLSGQAVPPAQLWVLSRGAVAADGTSPVLPAQAPAWGLSRIVGLEHPDVWGGSIDLDPAGPEDLDAVAAEILSGDGEDQVALRAGTRRVARLRRAPDVAERPEAPRVDPDAAYLVTGGRGDLGLRVASWLADAGARHLVLLGRSAVPAPGTEGDPVAAGLAALRARGVTVHTPVADVADPGEMAAVLAPAGAAWPPLRGVVHAAGVFTPAALGHTGWADFRRVLRPKVEGTLVLERELADADLDFFLMFSSGASVWGSALSGHYAAANAFLDATAHARHRRGLAGQAVNWGWWAGSDMGGSHSSYFESMGLHAVTDTLGFAALDVVGGSGRPQLTVAPVDWARFRPVMEAKRRRPLLEDLGPDDDAARPGGAHADLLRRLGEVPNAAGRRRVMEEAVQAEVAAVLGRGEARMDRHLGFFEAGMDSITSMELKARIEARLGAVLPATAAFEHPTVAGMAEFLLADVVVDLDRDPGPERDPGAGGTPAPAPGEDWDQLGEDDLLLLLEAELGEPIEGGTP